MRITLRQAFQRFDTDHSGTMSKGELKEYLVDDQGLDVEPGYIDELWKVFDADKSGMLDEKEWVLLCEHIKQDAAQQDAYEVHGSARLPGSKYTIGEIEINECETRGQLEKLVQTAKDSGHGGGGCCCFCKTESVLDTWKYEVREDWQTLTHLGPEPAGA